MSSMSNLDIVLSAIIDLVKESEIKNDTISDYKMIPKIKHMQIDASTLIQVSKILHRAGKI